MMLTRCPACSTTFRIRPEQAKARHGKVRCGRCQHVFDAIESLVDVAATSTLPPQPLKAAPEPDASIAPTPAVTPPVDDMEGFSVLAEVDTPTAPPEPAVAIKKSAESTPRERRASSRTDTPSPLSARYTAEAKPPRPVRWPWFVASALAACVLLGQTALAWRVDLATRYPDLREPLSRLCEPFDCVVGLPADPTLLKIETSDLHPSPQKKGQLELIGTLRNRALHAQTWPHLELTLTDGADRAIVRKMLAPADYVGDPELLAAGFPADGEFAVQVQLDVGNLPAAGYRLYLFYP